MHLASSKLGTQLQFCSLLHQDVSLAMPLATWDDKASKAAFWRTHNLVKRSLNVS